MLSPSLTLWRGRSSHSLLFSISVECFCARIQVFSCPCPLCVLWGREHLFLSVGKVHSTSGACVWKCAFLLQILVSWSLWQSKFKRLMLPEAPQLCCSSIESFLLMATSFMSTGMVLDSRMDVIQDKLLHTAIIECINSKNLVTLEGLSSFYWWYFFLTDDHVRKKKKEKKFQISKTKKGTGNNRRK